MLVETFPLGVAAARETYRALADLEQRTIRTLS
jgi:hypothetical protein